MAVSPNIFMLDIQTTGKPESASRNGRQREAAGSDFRELLSQRMQTTAGSKEASPVQGRRDEATQVRDARQTRESSQPQDTRQVRDSGQVRGRSMKDSRDARSQPEEARSKPAEAESRDDQPDSDTEVLAADGNNLPLEIQVLPLAGQTAPFPVQPESTGEEDFLTSFLDGMGPSKGGLSPQEDLVSEEGLEDLQPDGMGLDSLALDGDALPEPATAGKLLELSGGKSELADFKLQLQNLTGASALTPAAGAVREAQAPATPYTTSVQVPFNDPKWGEQMVNKVLWLASQNLKSAEVHLNPAELGPVELKIQVNQDQASIQVQAQNASVREALEQNVHRLREALASNGMGLAQFDVSGQAGQQQGQQPESARHQGVGDGLLTGGADEEQAVATQVLETPLPGLINTYV